jgi:hypothetical protein
MPERILRRANRDRAKLSGTQLFTFRDGKCDVTDEVRFEQSNAFGRVLAMIGANGKRTAVR